VGVEVGSSVGVSVGSEVGVFSAVGTEPTSSPSSRQAESIERHNIKAIIKYLVFRLFSMILTPNI
jgi:hypothetical protein